MKTLKALVIEPDEKTRETIDEILTTLEHKYHAATNLADAKNLLTGNGYAYILISHEIPSRSGGMPRMQNAENFLEDLARFNGKSRPPVVVMFSPMPDVDEEDKLRWAADMRSRGATTFICKPFRAKGRTLDRVIKKVLGIHTGETRHSPSRAKAKMPKAVQGADDTGKWLTVTDAAKLLMHDVPDLDLAKARSRISTAAGRKEFKFTGARKDRRIEPHTFATWRLKQRDYDLKKEEQEQ